MVKQYKKDEVELLVQKLKERNNIIITNYSGIKVKDLSSLRKDLREKNAEYRVVKNNLFKLALNEVGVKGLDEYMKGPVGVAFAAGEIGEVAKLLKEFSKKNKNFDFSVGVFEEEIYGSEQLKKIADLPSKDVILAQTMSLINGPATGIAIGVKEVMSSLARAIKSVAEVDK